MEKRREANIGKQIDNSKLPAGANMYYYCWSCGAPTAVKPEGWYKNPPPHHCPDCKPLVEEGLVGASITEYDVWLMAHDKDPVPR